MRWVRSAFRRNVSKSILFGLSLLTGACSSAPTAPIAPSIPSTTSTVPSAAASPFVGTEAPSLRIAPGDYVLTITADVACTGIPVDLRTRTFAATITAMPDRPSARWVDVSGSFLGLVSFSLEVVGANHLDTIDGLGLFERYPSFRYLYVSGSPDGAATSTGAAISTRFAGTFDYCVLKSELRRDSFCWLTARDQPEQVIAYSGCSSRDHHMILAPR